MKKRVHLAEIRDTLRTVEDYINDTTREIYELYNDSHALFQKENKPDIYVQYYGNGEYWIYISELIKADHNSTEYFDMMASKELKERCIICSKMINLIYIMEINNNIDLCIQDDKKEGHCYLIEIDDYSHILKSDINPLVTVNTGDSFRSLNPYKALLKLIDEHIKNPTPILFDRDGNILEKYANKSLEDYDLSKIDFSNRNLSHMDLSHNIENLYIDFSNIQKSLCQTNLEGLNMNGVVLRNFDLTDANLKNTSAGIDILTCMISRPEKLKSGTEFDKNNAFYFGDKKLSLEEAENIGIKIYKK